MSIGSQQGGVSAAVEHRASGPLAQRAARIELSFATDVTVTTRQTLDIPGRLIE